MILHNHQDYNLSKKARQINTCPVQNLSLFEKIMRKHDALNVPPKAQVLAPVKVLGQMGSCCRAGGQGSSQTGWGVPRKGRCHHVLLCLFFASEPLVSHCGVAVCSLPSLCWLPWGWKRPLLCVWRKAKTWLLKPFPAKTEESRLTMATTPCLQRPLPYSQHGSIPQAL